MAWKIEFAPAAERELAKLDREIARRILKVLRDRIAPLENPRSLGEALKGARLGNLWKYRIGDYRVIAAIDDHTIRIIIVRIGHRREVYRD